MGPAKAKAKRREHPTKDWSWASPSWLCQGEEGTWSRVLEVSRRDVFLWVQMLYEETWDY